MRNIWILAILTVLTLSGTAGAFDCSILDGEKLTTDKDEAYRTYADYLLLSPSPAEKCDRDDPIIHFINAMPEVLSDGSNADICAELYLKQRFKPSTLWYLDGLVQSDQKLAEKWKDRYQYGPAMLFIRKFASSVQEHDKNTVKLLLVLFDGSDGLYGEEMIGRMWSLFKDKPQVVLGNMDAFRPYEDYWASTFCLFYSEEERTELIEKYEKLESADVSQVVRWLRCSR